jgi:hypothetical protein
MTHGWGGGGGGGMTDDGAWRFRRTPKVAFWDPCFDLWHLGMGPSLHEVRSLDLACSSNRARHLRATQEHR